MNDLSLESITTTYLRPTVNPAGAQNNRQNDEIKNWIYNGEQWQQHMNHVHHNTLYAPA